jgi:hypothetical protein
MKRGNKGKKEKGMGAHLAQREHVSGSLLSQEGNPGPEVLKEGGDIGVMSL